ncbi:hypothetical protein NMY3_01115 [Candidatus Nitrosocosmicus oleophilus]|uniref:Uncharacterized protein n=1 Tax=Candidatus Nitrosocosmicus oleophilus TaxID=1353260 RepID=A0A654LWX2_9ARCH|nr:hypothetical protein NMY3_01115 [Candidatus Nitrosocosmicus oleophilus]
MNDQHLVKAIFYYHILPSIAKIVRGLKDLYSGSVYMKSLFVLFFPAYYQESDSTTDHTNN